MPFVPQRVFFEQGALDYPMGRKMWDLFKTNSKIELHVLAPKRRVTGIPGTTPREAYLQGKKTLVVAIRKTLDFQTCKPSAHYQLPLVTGCMGQCEYCYLNTQLGKKPYVRVYVNVEEILNQTAKYIEERKPQITIFEGAATSDPVPVEPYTGSLKATIEFFAKQSHGTFRFVTKYTDIESLLRIEHQKKTTIRFSINADHITRTYEHATPGLVKRLEAADKVARAGYPLGFMIGPVILFDGWEQQYQLMFDYLRGFCNSSNKGDMTFEIISHRFTARAKKVVTEVYPQTTLPMDEASRRFKYGQFGYGKYIYPPEDMGRISRFFTQRIQEYFPESNIRYIV